MTDPRGLHHTNRGLRTSGGAARRQRWRRQDRVGGRAFSRSGHWRTLSRSGHWRALSRSGHWRIGSPLRLDKGTKDEGGLDGTSGDNGERRGGNLISRSVSQSIRGGIQAGRGDPWGKTKNFWTHIRLIISLHKT